MAKFISRSGVIFNELKDSGRIIILTKQQSTAIDHALGKELKKIKNDYVVKEKNSRAFVTQMELGSFNR